MITEQEIRDAIESAELPPGGLFQNLDATESFHDSLEQIEVIMVLEEKYGIDIPDSAAEKICSIKDACDYLNSRGV